MLLVRESDNSEVIVLFEWSPSPLVPACLSGNPMTAGALVFHGPPIAVFNGMVLRIRLNDMSKSTVYKEHDRKGESFTDEP